MCVSRKTYRFRSVLVQFKGSMDMDLQYELPPCLHLLSATFQMQLQCSSVHIMLQTSLLFRKVLYILYIWSWFILQWHCLYGWKLSYHSYHININTKVSFCRTSFSFSGDLWKSGCHLCHLLIRLPIKAVDSGDL